jgi:D-xylulose reductase
LGTPPIHGSATSVVHPAAFTFKLPENVSGAMVETLAVGMHGANKAQIHPATSRS